MATDITERKLLDIMEDKILEKESGREYTYRLSSACASYQSYSKKYLIDLVYSQKI
jgi:hypothetical protein